MEKQKISFLAYTLAVSVFLLEPTIFANPEHNFLTKIFISTFLFFCITDRKFNDYYGIIFWFAPYIIMCINNSNNPFYVWVMSIGLSLYVFDKKVMKIYKIISIRIKIWLYKISPMKKLYIDEKYKDVYFSSPIIGADILFLKGKDYIVRNSEYKYNIKGSLPRTSKQIEEIIENKLDTKKKIFIQDI